MACSVGVKNLLHANHNHYTKEGRMSRILFFAMSLVLLSGAVAWAGNPDGEPDKGAGAAKSECKLMTLVCVQTWDSHRSERNAWDARTGNGGGGSDSWCVADGDDCNRFSWQTIHPIGWHPADDGKSTQEWIQFGTSRIIQAGAEIGVVITEEDLLDLEYIESWVQGD